MASGLDVDTNRLRDIKTFPSLVKYLRDDLDWPIESDDFEDVTFDWQPEELGIDPENAAKIQEIKQLRPLADEQPWGIFFVKFEPRKLPVVALRRILRALVVRKRGSAKKDQQKSWELHDLLFISLYGSSEHREIAFAHFAEEPNLGDLPTLRVLGWDDENTPLHLEHADRELREKLRWPDDEGELGSWRSGWSSAFALRHGEVIRTAKAMAERLAELAGKIRKRVNAVLRIESDKGPLRRLHKSFREALIHDLSEDDFADMYAQTVSYGLLTARISRPAGIIGDNLRDMVPITNPFLRDLLETFLTVGGRRGKIEFDELGVSEVVQMLRDADMEAVLRDFGDRNPQEDPAIHFYVLFLKEYDPEKRVQRGVFYTPRPVVSYIVRNIHELLRTEFGLPEGLASTATWTEMTKRHPGLKIPNGTAADSPFVQILDPALGTGTFLVEVIDIVHNTMIAKWQKENRMELEMPKLWNEYVSKHLLPRLHGYELMMAPYAIAHMKIGLKLHETGYRFGSDERARIYLTNSLEAPHDFSDRLAFDAPALAHEASAVNAIKRDMRFTVVMGNPPYSLMSGNLGDEQRHLIDPYRFVDGVKIKERGALQLEKNLQDDYVKFIRFAESTCERSPLSVMGFITNHSYLANPTLRGLRRSLMNTFSFIWALDLHGNSKRKERCPLPVQDKNVFDIQQGVAIVLMARQRGATKSGIWWGELWGSRDDKYASLRRENFRRLSAISISPNPPLYVFLWEDDDLTKEFEAGLPLDHVFSVYSTGVATARDDLTVHLTRADLHATVLEFSALPVEQARKRFGLGPDTNDWKVGLAIDDLKRTGCSENRERVYQYRPFDQRYTYYTGKPRGFLCNPRWPVMQHLIAGPNVALCSVKSVETGHGYAHVFVTSVVADHHSVSMKEVNYIFPALAYPECVDANEQRGLFYGERGTPVPNMTHEFLSLISERLGVSVVHDPSVVAGRSVGVRDIVAYLYCILHSTSFRSRYAAFLRKQIARIPIPKNLELFETAVRFGGELVALHLLESPRLDRPITTYTGPANPDVEKVSWSKNTVFVDKAQTTGFKGVREEVWNFHIGGYQVCEKWLKDRKGRKLLKDDIDHYQRIVVALAETIRLMKEIDEVIEKHGGWPAAFA